VAHDGSYVLRSAVVERTHIWLTHFGPIDPHSCRRPCCCPERAAKVRGNPCAAVLARGPDFAEVAGDLPDAPGRLGYSAHRVDAWGPHAGWERRIGAPPARSNDHIGLAGPLRPYWPTCCSCRYAPSVSRRSRPNRRSPCRRRTTHRPRSTRTGPLFGRNR